MHAESFVRLCKRNVNIIYIIFHRKHAFVFLNKRVLMPFHLIQYNDVKLHFKKNPPIDCNSYEYFCVSLYMNYESYIQHCQQELLIVYWNNICQFQDIRRIFMRIRERTNERSDKKNWSHKQFQLCWKALKKEKEEKINLPTPPQINVYFIIQFETRNK